MQRDHGPTCRRAGHAGLVVTQCVGVRYLFTLGVSEGPIGGERKTHSLQGCGQDLR